MSETSLVLEPYSEANSAWVLQWRNAETVRRFLLDDTSIKASDHQQFLSTLSNDPARRYFCVRLDGVRRATLNFQGVGTDELAWGCFIASDQPVPGLFPALLWLAGELAFKHYRARTLTSVVVDGNRAVQQLNAYLGMQSERRQTGSQRSGQAVTLLHYRLSAGQWPEYKERLAGLLTSTMRKRLSQFSVEKPS